MNSNGPNGTAKTLQVLEDRVETTSQLGSSLDWTSDVGSSVQSDRKSLDKELTGALDQSTSPLEVPNNADERCDASFSDELDGWRTSSSSLVDIRSSDEHSDECLTPELKHQRTHPLQPSLVLESPESNYRSSSAPPRARKGLEHSITAPVTTHRSLFLEGEGMAFSRSLTQRRDSPRRNLILDRLSEREKAFGHRLRLATHSNFRDFVKSAGIDFYPLGGDPRILAGYMARNKGLIPSGPGELSVQRKQIKAIIESLLPACTEPDTETGEPFRAQAIIANPPAYGHAHVAEALGVPLHIFFTMPWTPTKEFPHPLARVPQTAAYWLSYIVVDLLIWWGIRSYINEFRKKKLNLPPIAYFSTYHGSISHFPTGYIWSPHVVPKPKDWGPLVDVVGYCFLNDGSNYQPPEEFIKWIQNGSKPVYIGFGSMPLDDSKKTTEIILEALKNTGQRGILNQGWGDLGTFQEIPENVFLLAECPHDWLFPQCSAVVHHGGAGTTAAGLRAGCPTAIVPFFGDQFFWGDRIYQKGLGPAPIPISQLSVEGLSDAITFMLQPDVKSRVMELAVLLENEDGVAGAVDAFHRHLPSEIPLPTPPPEENDGPNPLQWLFTRIGKICCLPCGS
ncbi:Sterol 3-beta-glucosyltransferase UGT80B1 [Capsicum annuum]|nr:Sterol 3-beta-glucosyltransferase UGT80B1 [Capsicum annuum]